MRRAALLLVPLLLAACVSETVERRKPRKGPIKEVGFVDFGGGHVRYSTDGWDWFVAGRRRDAMRRMRKNCGKKLAPQVLDEYLRRDTDISYAGEDISVNMERGMDHFKIAPFQHMVYECRPKDAVVAPPAVSTAPPRVILVVPPPAEISTAAAVAPSVSTEAVAAPAVSTETR